MRTTPEALRSLPRGVFASYVRDVGAYPVAVPYNNLADYNETSAEDIRKHTQLMRELYSFKPNEKKITVHADGHAILEAHKIDPELARDLYLRGLAQAENARKQAERAAKQKPPLEAAPRPVTEATGDVDFTIKYEIGDIQRPFDFPRLPDTHESPSTKPEPSYARSSPLAEAGKPAVAAAHDPSKPGSLEAKIILHRCGST